MPTSPVGRGVNRQLGFTYAVVLVAIIIIGIAAETTYLTMTRIAQAEREAELLFRGQAYRRAIEAYYKVNRSYPRALEDLIKDPRTPSKRYIRTLYIDPMTTDKKLDWILIRSTDGGISGVSSRSTDQPIKIANFPVNFEKFNDSKSYSEWVFEYSAPNSHIPTKR